MRYSDSEWAERQIDFMVEVIWGHMFSDPKSVCETLGVGPSAVAQRLQRLGRGEWAKPYYKLNNEMQRERKLQKEQGQ